MIMNMNRKILAAFAIGETLPEFGWIVLVLLLGFISYGLSINFYISAQQYIDAAKTSAYYSIAPFLSVIMSLLMLGERPAVQFYMALGVMIVETILIVRDTLEGA